LHVFLIGSYYTISTVWLAGFKDFLMHETFCKFEVFCRYSLGKIINKHSAAVLLLLACNFTHLNFFMDYSKIIRKAWEEYDATKVIHKIEDISPMVSTNYVFRVTFEDEDIIIAKLSFFGKYEYFKEDHRIIHTLSNNLLYPYEHYLAKSLLRNNLVYMYRYKSGKTDIWVVFYIL